MPRGSASSRSKTAAPTSSKSPPCATGSPSASPRKLPFADRDAVQLRVLRRNRHSARRDRRDRLLHRLGIRLRIPRAVERDDRGEPGGNRIGADDAHVLRRESSAACSAARITFELLGSTKTDGACARSIGGDELGRGRVHRLPALDDLRRARALEQRPVARSRDDRDDLARAAARRQRVSRRSSRCSVCLCMFAISTCSSVPTRSRARAPLLARPCARAP